MRDLDLRAFAAIYGGPQGRWAPMMIALTMLGSGWTAFGLVPMLIWTRTHRLSAFLGGAIGVQAIVVWVIKLIVGRVRPWIAMDLPPPIGAPHDGSFPSGHAAGSFCVAAFLVVVLARTRWGPLLKYPAGAGAVVLATLIAVSRVYLGAHFPSDVLGGALLGSLIGATAGELYLAREDEHIRLAPGPADD